MTTPKDFNEITAFVRDRARSREYRDFMVNLLCDLVDIDTTTTERKLSDIVSGEHRAFGVLEKAIKPFLDASVTLEHCPINPEIGKHPYYTRAYYTATAENPQGLPADQAYRDRFNLLAMVKPSQTGGPGRPVILNAHMDTVSPFFPSRKEGEVIHGRGACDDKGSIVMLAAILKLQMELQAKFPGLSTRPNVYQFVIEEEPGGNGSLSAALDPRFKGYETIVCECTGNTPFPANRGAMWFQLDLDTAGRANGAQIIPFIIDELAREGRKLRSETNQPLFPKEYVQVNLGSLANFGKHPSAVNDFVACELTMPAPGAAREELEKIISSAVAEYCQYYADRTKEVNSETRQPKLKDHFALTALAEPGRYRLEIFGIGGHMSAMLLCDNALIKTGFILKNLIQSFPDAQLRLDDPAFNPAKLTLAGGVGFTPSHRMADLQLRLREAARRGIERYNDLAKANIDGTACVLTFDKLHNEAYASPIDCPGMKAFEEAFKAMTLPWPKPVAWRASCDARIYGNYGYNTIVCGPGEAIDAHSDHEKITVDQLQQGLEMVALTTFRLITGL